MQGRDVKMQLSGLPSDKAGRKCALLISMYVHAPACKHITVINIILSLAVTLASKVQILE